MARRLGIWMMALALAALGSLFAAPARAQEAPLMAPAAPLSGLRDGRQGTSFENPLFGPARTCGDFNTQFLVANPNIVEGEPLLLRLMIGLEVERVAQEFQARLAFGTDIRVIVYPPDNMRPYEYRGLDQGSLVPNSVLQMQGFKYFRYDFYMAVDQSSVTGAAFAYPGEYTIKVLLECMNRGKNEGTLEMGDFKITVSAATGPDRCALDLLEGDYSIYEYFQLRLSRYANMSRPLTEAQAEKLQTLIKTCEGAALRPHAMLVLADYYLRNDQYERCISLLDQLKEEYSSLPIHDEVLFTKLRSAYFSGLDTAPFEAFKEIWTDPVTSLLITPQGNNYKRFVGPFKLGEEQANTQWMLYSEPGTDPEPVGRATSSGPKLQLSEEVREQFGLPEFATQDELNEAMRRTLSTQQ